MTRGSQNVDDLYKSRTRQKRRSEFMSNSQKEMFGQTWIHRELKEKDTAKEQEERGTSL